MVHVTLAVIFSFVMSLLLKDAIHFLLCVGPVLFMIVAGIIFPVDEQLCIEMRAAPMTFLLPEFRVR
jgi:hypothetical protein